MELPFALNFLKKLDSFQVLKKLDAISEDRIRNYDGMVSTWEVEKKILLWAYDKHFHLGSPLTVDELRSRKNIALEKVNEWRDTPRIERIKPIDATEFETGFEKFFSDITTGHLMDRIREVSDSRRVEIGITPQESDKAGVRETFGNLVSRGYATYYPAITKIVTGYEGGNGRLTFGRPVYEDIATTQSNCEGIYITSDGLTMGELISDVSDQKTIENCKDDSRLECAYKNITGASNFLHRNWWWFFYRGLILVSYVALIVAIWIIIVGFKDMIVSIWNHIASIWIYFKF